MPNFLWKNRNPFGTPLTEEDVERSPQIVEANRNSALNAEAFTYYEMFDKYHPRGNTHTSYFVNGKGETLRMGDVNVTKSYRLLPYRDQQTYGNYWSILRIRPGAAGLTNPEYMPNNIYSFYDVNNDFRCAGMTILNSRL